MFVCLEHICVKDKMFVRLEYIICVKMFVCRENSCVKEGCYVAGDMQGALAAGGWNVLWRLNFWRNGPRLGRYRPCLFGPRPEDLEYGERLNPLRACGRPTVQLRKDISHKLNTNRHR